MKVQAIQIGTVALTTNWRKGVGHGSVASMHERIRRLRSPAHTSLQLSVPRKVPFPERWLTLRSSRECEPPGGPFRKREQ